MRSILLMMTFFCMVPFAWAAPYVGIILWCWIAFMHPQQLVWNAVDIRLNLVIAVVTVLGWLMSNENKKPPLNAITFFLILLAIQITFSTIFCLLPDKSWPLWDRHIKTMFLILMTIIIMNNRVRLHALIWVIVISIGYYSVQGGILGIVTGGHHHFRGPPGTNIGDNNYLALAMVIVIPLINYLRMQSANAIVRYALLGSIALTVVGVLTTYSRGGFIGLVTILLFLWFKSKGKIITLIFLSLMTFPAIQLMPDKWFSRIDTIDNAEQDGSFQGRLNAWEVSLNLALKHPFLGGGFSSIEDYNVTMKYKSPNQELTTGRAAHSIYFQVLGDLGFFGLFIYLTFLFLGWLEGNIVIRLAKNQPTLKWASDMANMIHVSLIGFMVSGAALSAAYFDIVLIQVAISSALRQIVVKTLQAEPKTEQIPSHYPA